MSSGKEYTLDKIKQKHSFIEHSKFYKIYNEYDNECNIYSNVDACYKDTKGLLSSPSKENELLKKLYSNLYKIFSTLNNITNDYFVNNPINDEKLCYLCLKYWLYDQIITKDLEDGQIIALFEGWKNHIENEIIYKNLKPCKFYNLNKDEINNIRKVYALYTIFYENNKNWGSCNSDKCEYMDYFGEALDEFINGINSCSGKPSTDNYCKEFDEFVNLCKDKNQNAGISIYHEYMGYSPDGSNKYLLSVEKYKDKPLYIYLKDEKLLNFVKTSHFISTKNRTTIAATSVVGSAIGLSSIFYYFYKFTPFGSPLRKGKGKNIVNIDEDAHKSLFNTSETEQAPFKSRKYNVAYQSFSNS
ncbi:unnamed protein product [Plasmodium vivax]|uniref:(malaria parasite P. vivax) hypothetical protein n=1 Tax=Plasmodium vivax TaxID=5855 RepID=A0A8S4HA71_PLAVI|nr:unnamed protein product [Plasmodium vivax]